MTLGKVHYRLAPRSPDSSKLLRDSRELGELSLDHDNSELTAVWPEDHPVEPLDAALGYALAAAFGTGAHLALMLLLQGSEVLGP